MGCTAEGLAVSDSQPYGPIELLFGTAEPFTGMMSPVTLARSIRELKKKQVSFVVNSKEH